MTKAPPKIWDESPTGNIDEDLKFLEEFCDSVECEEIEFEEWVECHQSLDLKIELELERSDVAKTGQREVKFCRTNYDQRSAGRACKIKESLIVSWKQPFQKSMVRTFHNLGDIRDGKVGRLIVSLRIRTKVE